MQRHNDSVKKLRDESEANQKMASDFYEFHDMAMAK